MPAHADLMDKVEVADTSRWSQEFVRYMDTAYSDIQRSIS